MRSRLLPLAIASTLLAASLSARADRIALTIENPPRDDVAIERWVRGKWQPVCRAPCCGRLDVGFSYRAKMGTSDPSGPFTLEAAADAKLRTRSRASGNAIELSIPMFAVGGLGLVIGSLQYMTSQAPFIPADEFGARVQGVAGMALGAILISGAIVLLSHWRETRLSWIPNHPRHTESPIIAPALYEF